MDMTEPFCRNTALTGYFPLPRDILDFSLSGTAILLYAVLLDRGTLSQKSGYTNQAGQVFVIYTIAHLAQTARKSVATVKRALAELEQAGLIRREHLGWNKPSRIFLYLPEAHFQDSGQPETEPSSSAEMSRPVSQKRAPTNLNNQQDTINYFYQLREDESV